MNRTLLDDIDRLTQSIAADIVDAVRRERAYVKGEPHSALLFLTYRCTSRCRTCKMWSRPWNLKEELSLEEWIKVTDILFDAGVHVMELFGGDVLLRKDVLFPLIRHLKKKGMILHIPTNSILLDENAAQELVDAPIDFLYLSTDGVEGVHNTMRGTENAFRNVQRAVAELVKRRKGADLPRLICNTTVSKYNIDSLDRIARFAAAAGFNEIHFEYVAEMTSEDVSSSVVEGLSPTPFFLRGEESALASLAQARLLKKELGRIRRKYLTSPFRVVTINIDCLSTKNLVKGSVPKCKCYTQRCEITVDPAGNAVACPFFHSFKLGNLLQEKFEKIWYGERHRHFHNHLKEKGLPMCRHCVPSIQRNHSFPVRLERIYLTKLRAAQKKLAARTAPV